MNIDVCVYVCACNCVFVCVCVCVTRKEANDQSSAAMQKIVHLWETNSYVIEDMQGVWNVYLYRCVCMCVCMQVCVCVCVCMCVCVEEEADDQRSATMQKIVHLWENE
jgi:hypothetical protein